MPAGDQPPRNGRHSRPYANPCRRSPSSHGPKRLGPGCDRYQWIRVSRGSKEMLTGLALGSGFSGKDNPMPEKT